LQNNLPFFTRQASQQLALWVEITIRKLPSFAVRLGKEKIFKNIGRRILWLRKNKTRQSKTHL
jgi:hypothetical protein